MPDAFWSLTPREFWIKFQAFHRAENRALWLVAKHALLTTEYAKPHGTPDKLLGYYYPLARYPEKAWLKPK